VPRSADATGPAPCRGRPRLSEVAVSLRSVIGVPAARAGLKDYGQRHGSFAWSFRRGRHVRPFSAATAPGDASALAPSAVRAARPLALDVPTQKPKLTRPARRPGITTVSHHVRKARALRTEAVPTAGLGCVPISAPASKPHPRMYSSEPVIAITMKTRIFCERERADVNQPRSAGTYHLLALSGGGVRGVFQARFLQRMEEAIGGQLRSRLSGIAATSTGSLVGLALAAGIPAVNIFRLYTDHSSRIFQKKTFAPLRAGGRYPVTELEKVLYEQFGDRRIGDLTVDVFVTASTADTYQGRLFTRADTSLRLVDVALASTAAPTYFPAHRVGDDLRAYLDGGLWANNPSFAAIQAITADGVSSRDISLISLGCGRTPKGVTYSELSGMRTLSVDTPRVVLDSVSAMQEWFTHQSLGLVLSETQYIEVNPILRHPIALDDWGKALEELPALADAEYSQHDRTIRSLLEYTWSVPELDQMRQGLDRAVVIGASAANLQTFVPARSYYKDLRGGRDSITAYISKAESSLQLVAVNLMTGDTLESILETFRTLITRPAAPVRVVLSLLDPTQQHLIKTIAPNLNLDPRQVTDQINRLIARALAFHRSLDPAIQSMFELHCHASLPSASTIMIDVERKDGVIQLETKAYSRPTIEAFGFEIGYGSELFNSLKNGYLKLIADGRRLV
jgi:patatin-like phospholipase/acyl hydrolase